MEKVHKLLKDSPVARWSALVLIALMMFFAYMFVDVLSPLQSMLENPNGLAWDANTYGKFAGSEYFLNVFALFLIFAGIILDKMGIRFTGVLSASLMVIGAFIKWYAISGLFAAGNGLYDFLNSFWVAFPATAKLASIGFMIFGCGTEMAGITVSKAIAKWFAGKEMALAMGLEMAIARLGVFAVFRISPRLAEYWNSVPDTVLMFCILLIIGLITYSVFCVMDYKLDKQIGQDTTEHEEPFQVKDLGKLFTSKPFLIVAFLCVLYYSAIFPFQKFAVNMLQARLGISGTEAGDLFSWLPIGAMILTPFLGSFLDHKGKGASMLIFGALLMIICHSIFTFVPAESFNMGIAYVSIILLGISFSLVPAALWPSVPKLVENRYLGSAYAVIFWIQNIGLLAIPMLIGWVLSETNPGINLAAGDTYNYFWAMLLFAGLGVLALILGFWLKRLDKKQGYGLEQPNIKK